MSKNELNHDFLESSKLSGFSFKKEGHFCIRYEHKLYIDQILNNYNILQLAKKTFFDILKTDEYIKNSGVALEYFLIDYLEKNILLNKINPHKWEDKGIDIFYGMLGIDITVSSKISTKERKLEIDRKKINSGENFFYEVEVEKGNNYMQVIKNEEVPDNLAIFQFNSERIRYLVNNGKQNFLENIKSLNNTDFIKTYNDFEIVKESFPKILNKIDLLIKNKSKEVKHNIYLNINGANKSNIVFNYKSDKNIIKFKVHSKADTGKRNDDTVIYTFKYYICDKKDVNNSDEEKILLSPEGENSESFQHSENQFYNKKIKLQREVKAYNNLLIQFKNYINKNKIDEEKIINDYINKKLEGFLDENENYIKIINYLLNFDRKKFNEEIELLYSSNDEIIEIKKNIYWLTTFIKKVQGLIDGEDTTFEILGNGLFSDEELLLKDPIFIENNFSEKIKLLENKYIKILNLFSYIDLGQIDIRVGEINSVIDFNELKQEDNDYISKKIQKIFFTHSIKFNNSLDFINAIIKGLKDKKEINNEIIKDGCNQKKYILKTSKNDERKVKVRGNNNNYNNNNNKQELNYKNKKINLLIKELEHFLEKAIKLRTEIKNIKFDDILLTKLDKKNVIYSRKFLSNIIIGKIFKGNKLDIRNVEKEQVIEKISKIIDIKNININSFISFVEMLLASNNINDKIISTHSIEEYLKSYISEIEQRLENKNHLLDNMFDDIHSKNELDYFNLIYVVNELLEEFFNKEEIKNSQLYISSFVRDFSKYNFENFDNYLIELIKKILIKDNVGFNRDYEGIESLKLIISDIELFEEKKLNTEGFDRNTNFDMEMSNIEGSINLLEEKLDDYKKSLDDYKMKVKKE